MTETSAARPAALAAWRPSGGRAHRLALGSLLAFGAANAFAGGWYGLAGAEGVPRAWLEGSPFSDYMVPSLVLFFVVGGSLAAASWAVVAQTRVARMAALGAGAVLLTWITVQLSLIGYVSWMQPATLVGALLVLALAAPTGTPPSRDPVVRLGTAAGYAAFIGVVGYDVVQLLQVLRLLVYPLDAILIFGWSLVIPVPFLLALLAAHYRVPEDRRMWTHGALLFGVIYATYVVMNYVVQLATVIPATLAGRLEEVRVLDQTPHSLFWDLDALGYIFFALALLVAVPAFPARGRGRTVRRWSLAHAATTPLIAFVYFWPDFSVGLLMLGLPWVVTAAGATLALARWFAERDT